MSEQEPTCKNRPRMKNEDGTLKIPHIRASAAFDMEEWFERFEKKHRGFVKEGKIYEWLDENVPKWFLKGCEYINILTLFIEKEVLGE